MHRIVLVTGGTKGIGAAIASAFEKEGDIVIKTARQPKEDSVIALNLLHDASIQECVNVVLAQHHRIDLLINCAGSGLGGAIEDFSMDQLEEECRINLIGTTKMIHAILPIMRKQKSGKIITIGSVAGEIAIPFQALYSASKAGLRSITQALRLELWGTGVQACIVEPGDTKTGFTSARRYAENMATNDAYRIPCEHSLNAMMFDEQHGKAPETVAKEVLRVARKKRMPDIRIVGIDYKLLAFAARILPHRLVAFLLKKIYLDCKKKDGGFRYPG